MATFQGPALPRHALPVHLLPVHLPWCPEFGRHYTSASHALPFLLQGLRRDAQLVPSCSFCSTAALLVPLLLTCSSDRFLQGPVEALKLRPWPHAQQGVGRRALAAHRVVLLGHPVFDLISSHLGRIASPVDRLPDYAHLLFALGLWVSPWKFPTRRRKQPYRNAHFTPRITTPIFP